MTHISGQSNILTRRLEFSGPSLTSSQVQMDGMLQGFTEGASDWRSLVAMTAGGLAYRATKLGAMTVGTRFLSPVLGLVSEVTVFRGANRVLQNGSHEDFFGKGFLTDCVNFTSLKVFGRISQGQNVILSHALQDVGMVAGHHLAYGLNLATRPEGTLSQQLLHAEITNLQMQAGMALGGVLTGNRLQVLERSLELQTEVLSASTVHNPFSDQLLMPSISMSADSSSMPDSPEVTRHINEEARSLRVALHRKALEFVSTLPPFNTPVPRLRLPGDYPGRKGGASEFAIEAMRRMKGVPLLLMDLANPESVFDSLYDLFTAKVSVTEAALVLKEGEREVGYQKFKLIKESDVWKLTFIYVWVDEAYRGRALRDQLQKNILASLLLVLRNRNEALEMTFHQVRNPYNVDRYLQAGLECVEEEEEGITLDDDHTYTWGVPLPSSFISLSSPPDPAYRIRFNGQMLKRLQ